MKIPFTVNEFLNVFEKYNLSIWPMQIVFYILAFVAIISIVRNGDRSNWIVFSVLTSLWLWMGSVYHIVFFSAINRAAYFFGLLFIIQGLLFLYFGIIHQKIEFKFNTTPTGILGMTLIIYALILYPVLGYFNGHVYPRSPTFGVPCPTTIFTFGLLLFATKRIPWYLIILPFFWSLIGFSAALYLSVKEDFGLVVAGVLSAFILLHLEEIRKMSNLTTSE